MPKEYVTHNCCDYAQERVDALESEVERLKRIVARELSENDELGSEYVYVVALKEDNIRLREALTSIACLDKPKQRLIKYWMRLTKMQCAEVLATDTQIARETLKLLQVTYENNK